jgi:RNA-directed DNA polymerase
LVEHFPDALRHAITAAGYRMTRWADDFVVVCRTRREAQTARALAGSFLCNELGVSLHPAKTRIVHVDHGFEFLGDKVKRGNGLRLSASKRTSHVNPHNLYAVPRERSVARFKDQIRDAATNAGEAAGNDRGDKPDIRGWGNLSASVSFTRTSRPPAALRDPA